MLQKQHLAQRLGSPQGCGACVQHVALERVLWLRVLQVLQMWVLRLLVRPQTPRASHETPWIGTVMAGAAARAGTVP